MRPHAFLAVTLLLPAAVLSAQTARFDATTRVFRLDSPAVTYAFGINDRSELQPLYWGARVADADPLGPAHSKRSISAGIDSSEAVTPQEFAGAGQGYTTEPSLKVTTSDGGRDLVLHYASHTLKGAALDVVLKDINRDIFVTLHYEIDATSGILARSAHIENRDKTPLVIDQAASGTLTLPLAQDFTLRYLAGKWAGDFQVTDQPIGPAKTILESRRGSSGHQNNPWFAIAEGKSIAEESGSVWFGALAWSGSWQISVERDPLNEVKVTGGFNAFDFAYALAPGESLDTPVFYAGYSAHGMGGASRTLHAFELAKILPGAPSPKLRPVLYNSWEATRFEGLNEASQMKLAETAAKIGVERYVVDDGWFGHRNTDLAGLGDWYVNKDKFPNGLKPLIDHVRSLGMDFGLWVEPEMVNPDSDLYRAHPDWVMNFAGRPRTEGRHQLILNLARPDVRKYVFDFLDKLLSENQISFFKWDYNRNWSEPGWPDIAHAADRGQQQKLYVQFVTNLYGILADLRAKHPTIEIEDCASGGGRTDLGMLRYMEQVWPSDNSDSFDRLLIADGLSMGYTPAISQAWVVDSPSKMDGGRITSLQYRYLSAMQGTLGIGGDFSKMSQPDLDASAKFIASYKTVRETIQHGALYRLIAPRDGSNYDVNQYVAPSRSQAVVFAFIHSAQYNNAYPTVRMRGLDPAAQYTISAFAGHPIAGTAKQASGAFWMNVGFIPDLKSDFQAAGFRFDKVK